MPEVENENSVNLADLIIFSTEEKTKGNYYVYAWVRETAYSYEAQVLSEEGGSSYPCRFELINANNSFEVVNVDIPRDGSFYVEDINNLFPDYVREKIYNVHEDENVNSLAENLQNEAKKYFNMK